MKTKFLNFIVVVVSLFLIQGCLPEDAPVPKRIAIQFNVTNVGTSVEREGNSVNVETIKIMMDHFILSTDGEARLEANRPSILRYRDSDTGNAPVFAGQLGFDFSTFTSIEMFIQQPDPQDNIPDRDLIDDGERYSIYMEGTYNGEAFEYQSKFTFNELLDFSSAVTIDGEEETLLILLLSDVADFMIDPETGQVLDPRQEENTDTIASLISQSFSVEASAEASIPLN